MIFAEGEFQMAHISDLGRIFQGPFVACEQLCHLRLTSQVKTPRLIAHAVLVLQGLPFWMHRGRMHGPPRPPCADSGRRWCRPWGFLSPGGCGGSPGRPGPGPGYRGPAIPDRNGPRRRCPAIPGRRPLRSHTPRCAAGGGLSPARQAERAIRPLLWAFSKAKSTRGLM